MNLESAIGDTNGRRIQALHCTIAKGSFLVYYFLAKDEVRCNPEGKYLDGSNEAGRLHSTFEMAEYHAHSIAQNNLGIASGIYDSSWKIIATFLPESVIQQRAKANSPKRLLSWATVLLCAGSLLLWLEVRSGWTLLIGFLVGARLLVSGFIKLTSGLYRLKEQTSRRVK